MNSAGFSLAVGGGYSLADTLSPLTSRPKGETRKVSSFQQADLTV